MVVHVLAPAAVHFSHLEEIKEYPSLHEVYAVALVHTATPVEQAVQALSAKKNPSKQEVAPVASHALPPVEQATQAPDER